MIPSQRAVDLIKKFEGCRLKSYQDIGGIWTIGFGATGGLIGPDTTWTQEQAESDLMCRLEAFGRIISYHVKPQLTQNQFDALICFCYNVGPGNFMGSTLVRLINERNYLSASDEFIKWNKVKGKIVEGLTNRRRAERDLFLS